MLDFKKNYSTTLGWVQGSCVAHERRRASGSPLPRCIILHIRQSPSGLLQNHGSPFCVRRTSLSSS